MDVFAKSSRGLREVFARARIRQIGTRVIAQIIQYALESLIQQCTRIIESEAFIFRSTNSDRSAPRLGRPLAVRLGEPKPGLVPHDGAVLGNCVGSSPTVPLCDT